MIVKACRKEMPKMPSKIQCVGTCELIGCNPSSRLVSGTSKRGLLKN